MTLRALLLCALVLCVSPLRAQEQPKPESRPAPKAQEPKDPPKPASRPAAQPSLDELLGIPKDKARGKPRPEAQDPSKAELDRKLSAHEVAEQFRQAVSLMGETAERLQVSKDTGLTTQRLQEDILRKLDQLIKAAEQNKRQSSSSQPQNHDEQKQQPNQAQPQRNPDGHEPAPDTVMPPPGQGANPAPGTAARGAQWGNLPPHIRAALMQSSNDKLSDRYRRATEAYYRRLAEEANR
jgi:hypothetical protein